MSSAWAQAFAMVLEPYNIVVMLGASLFGLFVGAMPGLTATMATALLVPVTFFMAPIPAIAAIVTATAMAIFAGDIPGCLLRMPGRRRRPPYTDEAYAMTNKGQAELALGRGLVFSAVGGLFGTAVLMVAAPTLAEFALKFSSFEYFWLVLMGLTCAVFLTSENPLKGFVSLFLGLLIASVGLNNPAGIPRFTFGSVELMGGIGLVPLMIGMFAISEILRYAVDTDPAPMIVDQPIGNVFKGMWRLTVKYPKQILRGSALGTLVGALPGAGADIAAWMSYAVSKKFSKEPEKFGTGHVEGIRRVRLRQQQRARGCLDSRAGVRHSRRLDYRDRDRRAVHEEHEPRTGALRQQSAEHLCRVPAVHHRQPDHDSAGLRVHQGLEADPEGAAQRADAGDHAVLRGRRVRDQQHGVRRRRDGDRRRGRVRARGERGADRAGDSRGGAGRHARGQLRDVDDQGRRQPIAFFHRPVAATLGAMTLAVWFLPILMRRLRQLAGA
jgi:TctA family transporter